MQLAGTLAHEVAHVIARHGAEDETEASKCSTLRLLRSAFVRPTLEELASSRLREAAADHIARFLMADVGFDPCGLVEYFEDLLSYLREQNKSEAPEAERTHPSIRFPPLLPLTLPLIS